MRQRSSAGSTLALVAACFLIILTIGIGFFLFAKVFGGANELQHITDSAALNVAKQSLRSAALTSTDDPDLDINGEFGGVLEESQGRLSLYDFDRIVGQTVFVMSNAESDGSGQGLQNAGEVAAKAKRIGNLLTSKIKSQIPGYFTNFSNFDPVAMFGAASGSVQFDQNVLQMGYVSFQKAQGNTQVNASSNIFINANQLVSSGALSSNLEPPRMVNGQQRYYVQGYKPISMAGTEIMAVPVRPFENPHLISLDTFKQGLTPPDDGVPPNAFLVAGRATDQQSGKVVERLAAAVVGGVDQGSKNPASFSHGFIIVQNTGGLATPALTTGGADVFAGAYMLGTEFGSPSNTGQTAIAVPGPGCFEGIIAARNSLLAQDYAWTQPEAQCRQWSVCPPKTPCQPACIRYQPCCIMTHPLYTSAVSCISGPPGIDRLQTGRTVSTVTWCHSDASEGLTFMPDACFDPSNMSLAMQTYPYAQPIQTLNPGGQSLMSIESLKYDVIRSRIQIGNNPKSAQAPTVITFSAPTGLRLYAPNPPSRIPFSVPGTPTALLNQINTSAGLTGPILSGQGAVLTRLKQRLQQLDPSTPNPESVLSTFSPDLGEIYAIYKPSPGQPLIATKIAQAPSWVTQHVNTSNPAQSADGSPTVSARQFMIQFQQGLIIDAAGDGGYPHPFDIAAPPGGWARDTATFQNSSGSGGLLGVLSFQNEVGGAASIYYYQPC